ncbi:Proteasome subunit beta type-6 [Vigna angularis]|uniref:Proteasome subunit beta type-6 n=1 Tax=Phaseolus angularis TaxID=3914 RepID=A0A8T0KKG0_PHAAN|nr:Proteasome subunit beta type-6 [Vigna angularis]
MDQKVDFSAPHSMGTTIIGVTYKDGVVLGADSRTSTGVYVANRASDKITQLTDNVYVCRSGSAADSQIVSDYVRYFLHQHTIQLGQPATVKVAANLVRLLSYNNKNFLETGLIVGGWDKYEGGQIFGVPLGGTIVQQPFAIGGSGSSYLYGFFDQAWKEGMSKEEAEDLVKKAVSLAIARDGASGGVVRTVIINSEGVTRNFYPGDQLPLWHEELEPHNSLLDILGAPEPMSIHRFKIKGRVYPAVLPVHNDKVNGRVLLGLSGVELHILDEFEDDEYTRTDVEVFLEDKSEKMQVYAYVWGNRNDPNLYSEWDFEEWKQIHMNDFVKMTNSFMEELESPESKPRVQTYEAFYKEEKDKPLQP